MIEKNVDPFIDYNGDNTLLLCAIPFPTFEVESIKVFVTLLIDGTTTDLVNTTDFIASNLGVPGVNASLTLVDSGQAWINAVGGGLDVQYKISIDFDSAAFQPAYFRSMGNYTPITMEKTFDRLTMNVKAIGARVDELDDTQTNLNTDAIAAINADIVNIDADILALENRATAIEAKQASHKDTILDNVSGIALQTIDSAVYEHMILEYIVKRNGSVQYGRQLLVGPAFTISPLEKVGDAGVSFAVTNSAGIGTLKYNSTNTGFAGEIQYRIYKFTL